MIEVKDLCGGYKNKEVLKNVSFLIQNGKINVIAGPNGCGKSTLIKSMAGILPISSGDVLIDGDSIKTMSTQKTAQKVAYLQQNRSVPDITAMKMVLHGRFPYLGYPRCYRKSDIDIAESVLEKLDISQYKNKSLKTLSGGTIQKAYIGMILAQDTGNILLDEPTTFLDISMQIQLIKQIRILAEMGKAVVLVLHDLAMAMQTADNIIIMKNGEIIDSGEPEKIFQTGIIDEVFGIKLNRFYVNDVWQYYYDTDFRK